MIDIQNINGYGIEDPGFALLREVAQKYCPEELQEARKEVIPDEVLDLSAIELLTPPPTPPLHGRGERRGEVRGSAVGRSGGGGAFCDFRDFRVTKSLPHETPEVLQADVAPFAGVF